MNSLTKEQKQEMLDSLGRIVIEVVRDSPLRISMDIVTGATINPLKQKQYKALSDLSEPQMESVCDLLSETITAVIYNIMEIFEENRKIIRFVVIKDNLEYDMLDISEKMGSEIACYEDEGWIQKFSSIGRFVL